MSLPFAAWDGGYDRSSGPRLSQEWEMMTSSSPGAEHRPLPPPLPPLVEGDDPQQPHRAPIIEALRRRDEPRPAAAGSSGGVGGEAAELPGLHRSIRVYISGRFYLIVPVAPPGSDAEGGPSEDGEWRHAVVVDRQVSLPPSPRQTNFPTHAPTPRHANAEHHPARSCECSPSANT